MNLPSRDECIGILRGAGCSGGVVGHCLNVTRIALRLAEAVRARGHDVDLALVEAGALLHDLGRCRTHSIRHAVEGGEVAREIGLPETVIRIIERHIGAGLPRDEAAELGLPEGDYVPETLEEKLVCYADKFAEGARAVGFDVALGRMGEDLGEDHPALVRFRALHEEMEGLLGRGPDL